MSEREKLEEIRTTLLTNKEPNKSYFGLLYWELLTLKESYSLEEINANQGSITLDADEDPSLAGLLAIFLGLWQNSQDLNAAARFIASSLGMSADELIQTRMIYERREKSLSKT